MKVAAIQMVSGPDVKENLRRCQPLLVEAASQGVQLVVLPENFALFDSSSLLGLGQQERTSEGEVRQFLSQQAKALGIYVIAGSLPVAARPDGTPLDSRVRAACLCFAPDGQEAGRYDKIHLFDVEVADAQGQYRESAQIEPGDSLTLLAVDSWKIGLSICYDLRFPVLYARLRLAGADIVVVPAAFTALTGAAHWEVLLRARAIENQVYVIAANQGGVHSPMRSTWGHSMIIDPWGVVMAHATTGEAVISAELSRTSLQDVRQRMPVTVHYQDVDRLG